MILFPKCSARDHVTEENVVCGRLTSYRNRYWPILLRRSPVQLKHSDPSVIFVIRNAGGTAWDFRQTLKLAVQSYE
jgi:hypothetical protein